MNTNKVRIIFLFCAVAVVAVVLLISGSIHFGGNKDISVIEEETGNFSASLENHQSNKSGEDKVLLQKGSKTPLKLPDLDYTVRFPQDMSVEVQSLLSEKIVDIRQKLKIEPNNYDEWISLGINLKIATDYEGAEAAWNYATTLKPGMAVAYANLGDLYAYYLENNIKAEENFLKAITNDPAFANYYLKAADFYREVIGNLNKSKDILLQGLKNVPDDLNLRQSLDIVNDLISSK